MKPAGAISFTWYDSTLEARDGDSIAAALILNGIRQFGTSRTGRPRGIFCGMGACCECLVVANGRRSTLACMAKIQDGMRVLPQDDTGRFEPQPHEPGNDARNIECDVAIVGAGPAGLSAACLLDELGLSVCVLDERSDPGGQYYKPRSPGFRGTRPPDRQHREGDQLRQRAANCNIQLLFNAVVWGARAPETDQDPDFTLRAQQGNRALSVVSRSVVLATGSLEVPPIVPGWTVPGVMTIGAAQTLARSYGLVPGENVLVASNGPLGLQLAAELATLGTNVVGLVERSDLRSLSALTGIFLKDARIAMDGVSYLGRLAAGGIRIWRGWEVARILGSGCVEGIILRRISDQSETMLAADTVVVGEGFCGQTELCRQLRVPVTINPRSFQTEPVREASGRTPVPGIWVVGDAGGLKGAQHAMVQGRLAGREIARQLGREAADGSSDTRQLSRIAGFQDALWRLYRAEARQLGGERVTICRCEEVHSTDVKMAIECGATDLGSIKRITRLGMGRCQGRYCTVPALKLLAGSGIGIEPAHLAAPQLPAKPVQIAAVAREKPEWIGHARTQLTRRPLPDTARPLQNNRADLAVIGGGITGIFASLHAAMTGADVVCLERGLVNCEASGGNAGSLHLQLLSWDFGERTWSAGPPLRTLPLQNEGIAEWMELEARLGADFEIENCGGMMVAETAEEMGFLKEKVAAERTVGVYSEVIGPDELRCRIPLASEGLIGAAWCPAEGKINPLIASASIVAEAKRHGARFEEFAGVEQITRSANGYSIATRRGRLDAGAILIAAGGWSAQLTRLLGLDVPVRGAPIQVVATEPAPPMVPCLVAHAGRHITMKQAKPGNCLIGGAWAGAADAKGHQMVKLASLEGNLWVAQQILPQVGKLCFVRSWASMNIDIDGAPLITLLPGHPKVALAAAANGYTMAPVLGGEAARLALTGGLREDLSEFGLDRFN